VCRSYFFVNQPTIVDNGIVKSWLLFSCFGLYLYVEDMYGQKLVIVLIFVCVLKMGWSIVGYCFGVHLYVEDGMVKYWLLY